MRLYYVGLRAGKKIWEKQGISAQRPTPGREGIVLCTRRGVDHYIEMMSIAYERRDIVVMYVDVPRRWLKKLFGDSWDCQRDIPPERVLGELFVED